MSLTFIILGIWLVLSTAALISLCQVSARADRTTGRDELGEGIGNLPQRYRVRHPLRPIRQPNK
jgi:hypothetical protein